MKEAYTEAKKLGVTCRHTADMKELEKWIRDDKNGKTEDATLPYYIRNKIDHPENQNNDAFTIEDLRDSIQEMQKIFAAMS